MSLGADTWRHPTPHGACHVLYGSKRPPLMRDSGPRPHALLLTAARTAPTHSQVRCVSAHGGQRRVPAGGQCDPRGDKGHRVAVSRIQLPCRRQQGGVWAQPGAFGWARALCVRIHKRQSRGCGQLIARRETNKLKPQLQHHRQLLHLRRHHLQPLCRVSSLRERSTCIYHAECSQSVFQTKQDRHRRADDSAWGLWARPVW